MLRLCPLIPVTPAEADLYIQLGENRQLHYFSYTQPSCSVTCWQTASGGQPTSGPTSVLSIMCILKSHKNPPNVATLRCNDRIQYRATTRKLVSDESSCAYINLDKPCVSFIDSRLVRCFMRGSTPEHVRLGLQCTIGPSGTALARTRWDSAALAYEKSITRETSIVWPSLECKVPDALSHIVRPALEEFGVAVVPMNAILAKIVADALTAHLHLLKVPLRWLPETMNRNPYRRQDDKTAGKWGIHIPALSGHTGYGSTCGEFVNVVQCIAPLLLCWTADPVVVHRVSIVVLQT